MTSIATKRYVSELARHLCEHIPQLAKKDGGADAWTNAVYRALTRYRKPRTGWRIYPERKEKKGEYLCDFMLFEDGYGPRIACESQWWHGWGDHRVKIEWSFDKLMGVKADIKVFIFEEGDQKGKDVWKEYLTDYALLSPGEAFLILRFEYPRFLASWWKPSRPGVHKAHEVNFELLD